MKLLLSLCLATLSFSSLLPAQDGSKPVSQGIVFKVEGGTAPMFLCGSVHLMQAQDFPLPAAYEAAFKASQRIVMEVPPDEMDPAKAQPALMKYALIKDGKLEEKLSADTFKTLKGWAKEKGVPLEGLTQFKPWLVALTVTQYAYAESGMKADKGIDVYFRNRLDQEKKTGSGLETMDDQFRMLGGFSEEIQDKMVLQAIHEAKEAKEELAKLLQAWRAGDTEAIAKTMTESFAELPEMEKLLLRDRNIRWLPKVKKMLAESTPTMVLVGAGHLCGDESLVALLRKEGFLVTQVRRVPVLK
jgi:uncharacterized protein YbaP (TraB family)